MPRDPGNLTAQQKAFCRHYIVDGNATAAVIKAGYSKNGAKQLAHKLLKRAAIKIEISRLRQKAAETTDRLLTAVIEGREVTIPPNSDAEAIVTRTYANRALIDVVEIGLGRRSARLVRHRMRLVPAINPNTRQPAIDSNGQPVMVPLIGDDGHPVEESYTVEETVLNLPAVNQAAVALHREVDRIVAEGGQAHDDDAGDDRFLRAAAAFATPEEITRFQKAIDVTPNAPRLASAARKVKKGR